MAIAAIELVLAQFFQAGAQLPFAQERTNRRKFSEEGCVLSH
jgi:hypothetical protein